MFGLNKYWACLLLGLQLTLGDLLFPEYQVVDKKKSNLAVSIYFFCRLLRILLEVHNNLEFSFQSQLFL